MKKLLTFIVFLFLSISVFAQVDFNAPDDDEFVSDVQWIIAPKDSIFYVIFETDDRVIRIKSGHSIYYKPSDFLMVADDDKVFERLDEIEHYDLRGHPTIFKFKEE